MRPVAKKKRSLGAAVSALILDPPLPLPPPPAPSHTYPRLSHDRQGKAHASFIRMIRRKIDQATSDCTISGHIAQAQGANPFIANRLRIKPSLQDASNNVAYYTNQIKEQGHCQWSVFGA